MKMEQIQKKYGNRLECLFIFLFSRLCQNFIKMNNDRMKFNSRSIQIVRSLSVIENQNWTKFYYLFHLRKFFTKIF